MVATVPFAELAGRVQLLEEAQERRGLRVVRIITRAGDAPPSLHLQYSHPLVEAGEVDVAELSDGSMAQL